MLDLDHDHPVPLLQQLTRPLSPLSYHIRVPLASQREPDLKRPWLGNQPVLKSLDVDVYPVACLLVNGMLNAERPE